jgi:hypothetical protein
VIPYRQLTNQSIDPILPAAVEPYKRILPCRRTSHLAGAHVVLQQRIMPAATHLAGLQVR